MTQNSMSVQLSGNAAVRKRKRPRHVQRRPVITLSIKPPTHSSSSASKRPQQRAALISRYHSLLFHKEKVNSDTSLSPSQRASRLSEIDDQITAIGGLDAYQSVSVRGHSSRKTAGFTTAKWVVSVIPEPTPASCGNRLRLLDVGALSNHYLPYRNRFDLHSIDINPLHSSVEKLDFFDISIRQHRHAYDIIVLSLVINFIPDVERRGLMLTNSHTLLRANQGKLALIIPRACIDHSKFTTHQSLTKCMKRIGFSLLQEKYSRKLYFALYGVTDTAATNRHSNTPDDNNNNDDDDSEWLYEPRVERHGAEFNNFAIKVRNPRWKEINKDNEHTDHNKRHQSTKTSDNAEYDDNGQYNHDDMDAYNEDDDDDDDY